MHRRAYILLTLTMLFWGANAVAGKMAVGHVSPMLLNSLRWLFTLILLLSFARRQILIDMPVLRSHAGRLFLLGASGFTGFGVALYSALTMTSAINVSIEQAAVPICVMILNFVAFRIGATLAQMAGVTLTVAGVLVTATHGELGQLLALDVNLGDALMLIAIFCYAAYTVGLKARPGMHWQSFMVGLLIAAFVSSIPFTLWEFWSGGLIMPTARGWAIVAFVVIFPSLLAQTFYVEGNALIGANRAGLFVNLVPIFGVLLSLLLLGEELRFYHLIAILLVLAGIVLAERGKGADIAKK